MVRQRLLIQGVLSFEPLILDSAWEKFLWSWLEMGGIVSWFLCHMATQKASVGVYVIIITILVCALLGTAISIHLPSTFVNCSCFIALWAINISQYYHLAWFLHSMLNSIIIGQHFVFDFVHYPVPHCLWITLFMCQVKIVCLGELLKFKLVIVSLLDVVHCSGNIKSMA